ncbi:UNVERIFIED_CONTAM: hypothetical protein GTU68_032653 [Idotea baltica]|nr:hypothetical protein [Idotea baltica]
MELYLIHHTKEKSLLSFL